MTGTAPAGWYTDGGGALRWWDGTNWTEHLMAPPTPPPVRVEVPAVEPSAMPAPTTTVPALQGAATAPPTSPSAYDSVALASWSSPALRPAGDAGAAARVPAMATAQPQPSAFGGVFTPAPAHVRLARPTSAAGAIGGWLMVLGGLVLLAFGLWWFFRATSRGYVSTGWLVSGGILTFRGVMRVRGSQPFTLRLPGVGFPWRRVGAFAAVGLAASVAVVGVRAFSGPGPLVDLPTMSPPSTGAWPSGYTGVASEGAYRRLDTTSLPCRPGFRCSDIAVLTRTECRQPQVTVEFFDADGMPLRDGTAIGFQNSSPGFAVTVGISTANPAVASYAVRGFSCND